MYIKHRTKCILCEDKPIYSFNGKSFKLDVNQTALEQYYNIHLLTRMTVIASVLFPETPTIALGETNGNR